MPSMRTLHAIVAVVVALQLCSSTCSAGFGLAADHTIESCPMEKAKYFAPVEVPQATDAVLPPLHIRQGEVLDTEDEAVRTGGTLWPAGKVRLAKAITCNVEPQTILAE
jgi:hypothetical protein